MAKCHHLRWLNRVFQGQYLPRYIVHCHLQRFGNITTTTALDKHENLLWSGFTMTSELPQQQNDAITYFTCNCIFLALSSAAPAVYIVHVAGAKYTLFWTTSVMPRGGFLTTVHPRISIIYTVQACVLFSAAVHSIRTNTGGSSYELWAQTKWHSSRRCGLPPTVGGIIAPH